MNYFVGDLVICGVEIRKNGGKAIINREKPFTILEPKAFQIVAKDPLMESYTVIVDDDMVGWIISKFHVEHWNVPKAFLGKKFFEVTENYIIERKK